MLSAALLQLEKWAVYEYLHFERYLLEQWEEEHPSVEDSCTGLSVEYLRSDVPDAYPPACFLDNAVLLA